PTDDGRDQRPRELCLQLELDAESLVARTERDDDAPIPTSSILRDGLDARRHQLDRHAEHLRKADIQLRGFERGEWRSPRIAQSAWELARYLLEAFPRIGANRQGFFHTSVQCRSDVIVIVACVRPSSPMICATS